MVLPLVWRESPYWKASSSICWSGGLSPRWPVTRNSGPAIFALWKYWRPADFARYWKMSLSWASLMVVPSSDFSITSFGASGVAAGVATAGVTGAIAGASTGAGVSAGGGVAGSAGGVGVSLGATGATGSIKSAGAWAWSSPAASRAVVKVRNFAAFMIVGMRWVLGIG